MKNYWWYYSRNRVNRIQALASMRGCNPLRTRVNYLLKGALVYLYCGSICGCLHTPENHNRYIKPAPAFSHKDFNETSAHSAPAAKNHHSTDETFSRILTSSTATSSAAATRSISIEEAAILALENNLDLRIQRFEPIVAGTFEMIERGVFDPELFAEGTYGGERASEVARATENRFDVLGSRARASVGVRKRFATGTDIETIVEYSRDESNRTPEQQSARLGLTVTQALLRGFGPAVNLASVRQANLEEQASIYVLRGYTEFLLAETELAYWNYVLAQKEISIYEQGLIVAEKERDETIVRIDVGALPNIEAPAAEAEVARRRQELINARSRAENARLQLSKLIYPFSEQTFRGGIEPISSPEITSDHPTGDIQERESLAEKYRPDLHEAMLRKEQRDLDIVVTRNGLLPRLDLFFQVGKTGFSDSLSGTVDALGENTFDAQGGLRLSAFLPGSRAIAQSRAARANQQKAALAIDNLRQVVRLDVRLAINEVERAKEQIVASKATRELQEQVASAEKERFSVGTGTTLLVAQAQRDLLSSQIAEVRAIIDYRAALVLLYRAEGTLLARRGITVDPS